jgi:ubiquinone/menaquinone biosynthesis C-methylase UbiE
MISLRKIGSRANRPSIKALLKRHADIYDGIAPRYHAARFGTQSGRYDLEETRILVKEIVSELLARRSDERLILDVACGTGKIAIAMAGLGGNVVAVDAAMGMLQQCSANAKEAGVTHHVLFTNGSAGNLPYRDNTFDMVLSFRFLHLFPREGYPDLIRDMARVVKPGGYVMVEIKNRWYMLALFWVKDLWRALKGETEFSSYASIRQLPVLAQQVGGVTLRRAVGSLLPKGWWLTRYPRLAQLARVLARGPLKSMSAYLVAVYQKDM